MTKNDINAILGGRDSSDGTRPIPVWYDYFAQETLRRYGPQIDQLLGSYPDDFVVLTREDEYWGATETHAEGGVGSRPDRHLLESWDDLDRFLADTLPSRIGTLEVRPRALQSWRQRGDRFVIGHWWYGFSENLTLLRGAENALTDVLLEQEMVTRLFEGLLEYFRSLVRTFTNTYHVDAIWLGDDYGMQDRPMYSPEVFRDVFKPFLSALADEIHEHGQHFFLHSCGNVRPLLPQIVESGVDVLHPVQPGTMDTGQIVQDYGDKLGFFVGMDVQHVLVEGTPDDVSRHVHQQAEHFRDAHRGVLATTANTIMPETPWENIEALFAALSAISRPRRA